MHKAKVNTKNSDATSSGSKNPTLPPARERALENDYAVFYDRTIEAADRSTLGAAPLMRELNRMHQVVTGLGVVLRIVACNSVLDDNSDPNVDPPPLSKASEYALTAMAAAICEGMCAQMEHRADFYNDEAES